MIRSNFAAVLAIVCAGFMGCRSGTHTISPSNGPLPESQVAEGSFETSGPPIASIPQQRRFAIFGPAFSDPRLCHGKAPRPWQYAYNICLAGSQLTNTLLGGDPDESLSSRLGRAERNGVAVVKYGVAPVVDVLLGTHHCQESIEDSESRLQEVWSWH